MNVMRLLALCVTAGTAMSAAMAQTGTTAAARLTANPARPEPGAIVRLAVRGPAADSIEAVEGSLAGEPLHFMRADSGWRAIGGIPTSAEGTVVARAFVRLASGRLDTLRASMILPPIPKPKVEPLRVDSSFSRPMDSATSARVARENALAREVGRRSHESAPMWTASFLRPRQSRVTSSFGSGRVFNGAVSSRHLGVDYAGAEGAPILAANRGVVALVDTFFLAGRVVYIDHGGGVVTGYFHMSEPLVAAGDTVQRGQRIGLVGATGRVTGPHLHWTARYGTITVNPGDLLRLDRAWYPGRESARSQR